MMFISAIIAALLLFAPIQQAPTMILFSPSTYQVFQRADGVGEVLIAGQLDSVAAPMLVEYRIDGGDWLPLATDVTFRFDAEIELAEGQYAIDVRADTLTISRSYVGVGDIIIVAGQSNASSRGTSKQLYSHPTLRASLYSNGYTWGELLDWTDSPLNALDPVSTDGVTTSIYGSPWPLLATYIMADQNVPVAFIPVAKGGSIIASWLPSESNRFDTTTLYGAMLRRFYWAGGAVRAVLWWQGESDAGNPSIMPAGAYARHLGALAAQINADIGAPVFAARISQMTDLPDIRTWAINRGVDMAVAANPGILFAGPDLSDLLPDDGQHIKSTPKLQEAALRWWQALEAVLYEDAV